MRAKNSHVPTYYKRTKKCFHEKDLLCAIQSETKKSAQKIPTKKKCSTKKCMTKNSHTKEGREDSYDKMSDKKRYEKPSKRLGRALFCFVYS